MWRVQSSILKYDHGLPSSIFDQTIRKVIFMSLAASSYNKEWLSFIAENWCKVKAASLIFSFVPQNQIYPSRLKDNICVNYHINKYISQSQKCDPTDSDEMWKMNFKYRTFWIMWHQGQDVKSHFLKNSPHAFQLKDVMLFFICREENAVTDVNVTWLSLF